MKMLHNFSVNFLMFQADNNIVSLSLSLYQLHFQNSAFLKMLENFAIITQVILTIVTFACVMLDRFKENMPTMLQCVKCFFMWKFKRIARGIFPESVVIKWKAQKLKHIFKFWERLMINRVTFQHISIVCRSLKFNSISIIKQIY